MAISLKHSKNCAKADGVDTTVVQPSDWNAEHAITAAAGKVLGTTTSSTTVSELPIAVDSSGNVGIGTSSPAAKLDVNGTIGINGSKGTAGQALISGGSSTAPSWGTPTIPSTNVTGLGSLATLSTVGTAQITDNSVTGAKIALGSDAQGDVMYYNGTDWVRLPAGTSGQLLQTKGSGANPEWVTPSYAPDVILEQQETSGTPGGGFSSGSDVTRVLNTEVRDASNICTLSSNQFTLPAGTYYIRWRCPAYAVGSHQSMLYNVTSATTVRRGYQTYGSAGTSAVTESCGDAVVTVAGSTAFEIRHRCSGGRASDGLGYSGGLGTEIYTAVQIWKTA